METTAKEAKPNSNITKTTSTVKTMLRAASNTYYVLSKLVTAQGVPSMIVGTCISAQGLINVYKWGDPQGWDLVKAGAVIGIGNGVRRFIGFTIGRWRYAGCNVTAYEEDHPRFLPSILRWDEHFGGKKQVPYGDIFDYR